MTNQHTPSPWTAENGMVYALDDNNRVNRFSAMITGGYSSAPVHGERVRTTPEELAANARLIAEAPDLLAALRGAMHLIEHAQVTQSGVERFERALDAIAKATQP